MQRSWANLNRNRLKHFLENIIDRIPARLELSSNALADEVSGFLRTQSVLHLATNTGDQPWCAAVYFTHRGRRFYFFSDKDARHCPPDREAIQAAAAVSADDPDWRQIRGIQMTGVIRAVNHWRERAAAIRLYLLKFPFVEQFLRQQFSEGRLSTPKAADLDLYVFEAGHLLYLDNRRGFGTRLEVDPGV